MSNWINKVEEVLIEFEAKTHIPFRFERMDCEEKQLPDEYITYFLVSAPPALSVDGKERAYVPKIQISFFYRNISSFLTMPDKLIEAFIEAGFTRVNEGRIPYQMNTGHYGWRSDFIIYETR